MRVTILTASLMLTSATVMLAWPAPSYAASQCKMTCTCDCPVQKPVKTPAKAKPMRHAARRAIRHYARHEGYYDYATAAPLRMGEWHGAWHVAAPGHVPMPGPVYYAPPPAYYPPQAYGPPPGYYDSQMQIDDRGFTGGVGYYEGGGGGGGGFADGFGQLHFANGGSAENGPTYNSYNQSFQFNPSMGVAGPFQARSMGGFAPSK
jgi:hypothetical protein